MMARVEYRRGVPTDPSEAPPMSLPRMRFTVRRMMVVAAGVATILTGCPGGPGALVGGYGEDSWAHYAGGGMFNGGTPSMSPDGAAVVFSTPCSGHGDVVRVGRDGSGRVRLTKTDDYEAQ